MAYQLTFDLNHATKVMGYMKKYALPYSRKKVIMNMSLHARQRMSQRGIIKPMLDIVVKYGSICQDKIILGKKDLLRLIHQKKEEIKSLNKNFGVIEELEEIRILKKIADKGGLVVVSKDNLIITVYNLN